MTRLTRRSSFPADQPDCSRHLSSDREFVAAELQPVGVPESTIIECWAASPWRDDIGERSSVVPHTCCGSIAPPCRTDHSSGESSLPSTRLPPARWHQIQSRRIDHGHASSTLSRVPTLVARQTGLISSRRVLPTMRPVLPRQSSPPSMPQPLIGRTTISLLALCKPTHHSRGRTASWPGSPPRRGPHSPAASPCCTAAPPSSRSSTRRFGLASATAPVICPFDSLSTIASTGQASWQKPQ